MYVTHICIPTFVLKSFDRVKYIKKWFFFVAHFLLAGDTSESGDSSWSNNQL